MSGIQQTTIFWTGVVEDRNDPLQLGRCRVRIFGLHTEDKTKIPTEDLPWALTLMPVTGASSGGIGASPSGLVPGSWVVGIFQDGSAAQMPLILGSILGIPTSKNPNIGFNDPSGEFPRSPGTSDTSKLAQGTAAADSHASNSLKRQTRVEDVTVAKKPDLETLEVVVGDNPEKWSEPPSRDGRETRYPLNHVTETESGHVMELDDTPLGERMHFFHRSGSYSEFQPSGQRVDKIITDSYEIVLGNKSILIRGRCDLTIEGDMRTLVRGDHVLEVVGNSYENIHGSKIVKIGQNEQKEIIGSSVTNIGTERSERIGGDSLSTVVGTRTETTGGNLQSIINGKSNEMIFAGSDTIVKNGARIAVIGGSFNLAGQTGINFTAVDARSSVDIGLSDTNVTKISVPRDLQVDVGRNTTINTGTNLKTESQNTTINSSGSTVIDSGGDINISSSGNILVTAFGRLIRFIAASVRSSSG